MYKGLGYFDFVRRNTPPGPEWKTHADSTHSHSLTMPRNPIQLGTVLSDRTGFSASGGGISLRWNTEVAAATVPGGVWQGAMPRFGCDATRDKESAPTAVTVFETLVAMKPHTGPAAGKHDPGG